MSIFHRLIVAMGQGGVILALLFFSHPSHAVTLEDLYRQSGIQRMPAVKPKGSGAPIPLKRIPVGGVPGIVIGMAAAYILEQGENGMDYLRQQAGADAGGELPTPDRWTDPDTPPLEGGGEIQYREEWTHSRWFPEIVTACAYHADNYGPAVGNPDTYCLDSWTQPTPGYKFRSCPTNSTNCNDFTYNSTTRLVCEGGYSANGNGCQLFEPADAKWPSDNVPTISLSGGQFQPHPRDPDSQSLTNPTSNISVTGTNEDGEPVRIDYTARPDGGLDIRVMTQFSGPDGTTAVNDYRTEINNNGVVQNVVNYNTYNTSLNDYAGPMPAPGQGTAPVEISIDLPTDYARENTLQSIKTDTNKLASGEMTATIDPEADHGLDAFTTQIEAVGGDDPAWLEWMEVDSLFPSLSCSLNLNWSFKGAIVDYGNLCTALDVVRSILGWIIAILTISALFTIVGEAMRVRT